MVKKYWNHGIKPSCFLVHQSIRATHITHIQCLYSATQFSATWQEVEVSILILMTPITRPGHIVVIHWPSSGRGKLNKTLTSRHVTN